MKIFFVCCTYFFYTYAFASVTVIDKNNIIFIYEANSEQPMSNTDIVKLTSEEVIYAKNEFIKQDLILKNKSVVKNKLLKFNKEYNFIARLSSDLGSYDFNNNGFKLKINNSIYLPFRNSYRVNFENSDDFNFLQLEQNKAKKLIQKLQKNRNIIVEFHGILTKAEEYLYGDRISDPINKGQLTTLFKNIKTVRLFINKTVIYSTFGKVIKTIYPRITYDDFVKSKSEKECLNGDEVFNIGSYTTVDEIKHSISCGADIHKRSKGWFGLTPLQWAKEFKNIPVIRFLNKELKKAK
ncbi:hypothetical protein SPONN_828 [uncultured Candidatus Thioglobus sp.]|nr:hypothetical protein SPONN_828 [uncultured Candidatus Thioglobus sp.]